eukprot:1602941-Amphidinium_carterae.1
MAVETILEAETILENQIVREFRLNRDRKNLPKLEIIEQHYTIPAATMQQKILNWVRDATKKIGTWHLDAVSWLMDHEMLIAVVIEAFRMLALVLGPGLCGASHTVCSRYTEGSIDDGVLILKGDVVHVSEAPETSSHS